ncbi:MAG: TM2 domain-containing protein [Firmicutes bacterium]|nr:TM2 domain-containing protein [Bacillota bacterium]
MQNDNKNNKSESDLNLNESSQSDFILDETDTDQKQDNKINYDKETNIVDPADVENYIMSNRECFPGIKLIYLKSKLLKMDKDKFERICLCDLKSPTIILLVSVFLGGLGIDRFMIGDIGMGILKLLTGGLCGIFWIYDIFTITERVKKINFESIILLT